MNWENKASSFDDVDYGKDPDNVFLWRMSKRRLEGEAIRDAMLSVSGELDRERPVGSAVAKAGDGIVGRRMRVRWRCWKLSA